MNKFTGSYWDNTGKFQQFVEALQALVPVEGSCSNPRSTNRWLEKFRVASNAYYDIFNNGGMNRGGLIRRIFDLPASEYIAYGRGKCFNWGAALRKTEPVMDDIILKAAVEQGLIPADCVDSYRVIVN